MTPDPVARLAAAGGGGRDPASIREAARQILARPEFRQPPESLIDRFRHWLGREVAKVLDDVVGGHFGIIGDLALLTIVVLVVWAVVRAARRVQRDPSARGVVVGAVSRTPAEWLAEAAACERRGDWRGALRSRYRALVAELTRRGLVDDMAGRTSGEYRVAVSANLPLVAGPFGGATDLFEQAVYGDAPTGPTDSARIQELADTVLAGTR